jgi:uncharacterized protein with GYD domain
MSALGQKRTFAPQKVMSALASESDTGCVIWYALFEPIADIGASGIKDGDDYFMAGTLLCTSAGIAMPSFFWKVGRSSGVVITTAP